jgi:hypothetical protein
MTNQIGFPSKINSAALKDAALIYAGEGYLVFPLHFINAAGQCSCGNPGCASPGKHPITKHGLKDASNDPDIIAAWWAKYPKANIGLCTGNGLVVIDFDLQHGASADSLLLPDTLRAETGNGYHLYFKTDQAIRNSSGKLGAGIDIRGDGGYVVAPPSIHFSGKQYLFSNDYPIAELPDAITRLLLEPALAQDEIIVSEAGQIDREAVEGNRNDFLTKSAGSLRRKGFSADEIEALLLVSNQKRCKPPLSDREVRRIAKSVSRYSPAETIDIQIEDDQPASSPSPVPPSPGINAVNMDATDPASDNYDPFAWDGGDKLLGAITAEQLSLTVFAQPEMLLQGLYRGDWGLVVGIGSVGKTTLMHNMIVCLAAGRPFPPIIPEDQPPRRILYLDFESNPWRLQQQISKLREVLTVRENLLVDENLHFAIEPQTNGQPWRLTDRQSLLNLAKYVQDHKIDLVIIDTLSQAAALNDENSNSEVQNKVVTPVRRLVRHCDCGLLLLHHEGKGKTQTEGYYLQYRARGSSALVDGSRYSITVMPTSGQKGCPVTISNSKDKGGAFPDVQMQLDIESRWFGVVQPATPATQKTLEDILISTLACAGEELPLAEIYANLPQHPQGSIRRAMKNLEDLGTVTRRGRGLYGLASWGTIGVPKNGGGAP